MGARVRWPAFSLFFAATNLPNSLAYPPCLPVSLNTTADGPLPRKPVSPASRHRAERRALLPADLRLAGPLLLCGHALGQHLGAAPVCGSHSRCRAGCRAGRGCLGAFQRGWKESNGPENLHSGCPDAQPACPHPFCPPNTSCRPPAPLCRLCCRRRSHRLYLPCMDRAACHPLPRPLSSCISGVK